MNAISLMMHSTSNTLLFLIRGQHTEGTTTGELKRVELDNMQLRWDDTEGPDGKVSGHTGCLATQG
jgi:hypothetical protein